jgi:hypothetical protein
MAEIADRASRLQRSKLSGCGKTPSDEGVISSRIADRAKGVELMDASMRGRTLRRKRA